MLRLRLPDAEASGPSRRRVVRPRVQNHSPRKSHPTVPSLPEAGAGLFELFRDAVVAADLNTGQIVLWNPAAEALFGYPTAEAIGMQVESLMPPAVARLHRERVAHFARTREAAVLNGRSPLGMSVLTRSGDEVRVEMSLAPMEPEPPGSALDPVRHILLMFRDARPAAQPDFQALEVARAESARAETEAKLHMSQDLLHDSVCELDAAFARARRAAAQLARLAKRDATGRPQRVALMARVVELRTEGVRHALRQIGDAAGCQTGSFQLETDPAGHSPQPTRQLDRRRLAPAAGRASADRGARLRPTSFAARTRAAAGSAPTRPDLVPREARRRPAPWQPGDRNTGRGWPARDDHAADAPPIARVSARTPRPSCPNAIPPIASPRATATAPPP